VYTLRLHLCNTREIGDGAREHQALSGSVSLLDDPLMNLHLCHADKEVFG
jgi:hypothetical protein